MRGRWRWSIAGAVGLAVAASLFVLPAIGEGPVTAEVGVLRLQLDSGGDKLVYDPTSGPDLVQTLSQKNCQLSSSGDSLVKLTGASSNASKKPFVGLKDHSIGVGQSGEGSGESCAKIDGKLGQTLTLSLIGSLQGPTISYAEIDLGTKSGGEVTLELRRAGNVVDTVKIQCKNKNDCGTGSYGKDDNVRVILYADNADKPASGKWQALKVKGLFDTIVIKPGKSSTVSLDGGHKGSPAGPLGTALGVKHTLFKLVDVFDGDIDCADTVTLGGGADATQQITRGNDSNGACKGPANGLLFNFDAGIENGRKFVDFVTEPVDGDPATVAQFLEVITWTFEDPPSVEGGSQFIPISYDDHVGAGIRVMPWCLQDPRVGGSLPSPLDPATVLPSGHTSCLIESENHSTLTGDFVSIDTVYNVGDGKRYK